MFRDEASMNFLRAQIKYVHRFEQVNIREYSAPNRSIDSPLKFHSFVLAENAALNYLSRLYLIFRRTRHYTHS